MGASGLAGGLFLPAANPGGGGRSEAGAGLYTEMWEFLLNNHGHVKTEVLALS